MTGRLYRWVDRRGRVPAWVQWLWPRTHFCAEWDGLLVTDGMPELAFCLCGYGPEEVER